jgi:hypothetical protein
MFKLEGAAVRAWNLLPGTKAEGAKAEAEAAARALMQRDNFMVDKNVFPCLPQNV